MTTAPVRVLMATAAFLLATSNANAAPLFYGLQSNLPGDDGSVPPVVYAIDPLTATATVVTTLKPPPGSHTVLNPSIGVGAEFMDGVLWGSNVWVAPGADVSFGTIDLITGVYTPVKRTPGFANWTGLAGNDATDILYSVDGGSENVEADSFPLYSLTTAGVLTRIGPTRTDLRGLAFNGATGGLYGVGGSNLYNVNTTTGATTLIGALGVNTFPNNLDRHVGLAYAPSLSTLFMAANDNLYRVNPLTGQATLLGSLPRDISGLAFLDDQRQEPIPEPASIVLLGMGVAGVAARRWRRRS